MPHSIWSVCFFRYPMFSVMQNMFCETLNLEQIKNPRNVRLFAVNNSSNIRAFELPVNVRILQFTFSASCAPRAGRKGETEAAKNTPIPSSSLAQFDWTNNSLAPTARSHPDYWARQRPPGSQRKSRPPKCWCCYRTPDVRKAALECFSLPLQDF